MRLFKELAVTVLRSVASLLVKDVYALEDDLSAFSDPPSPVQVEAIKTSLNRLQGRLNRLQAETDAVCGEVEHA